MKSAAERFLEAQEALHQALATDDDGAAFRRAAGRLEAAFDALRDGGPPPPVLLERMRSLAALLSRDIEARDRSLRRELGKTKLALDLVRRRSMGARPGRKLDLSG